MLPFDWLTLLASSSSWLIHPAIKRPQDHTHKSLTRLCFYGVSQPLSVLQIPHYCIFETGAVARITN